jgi:hypothetical protein
MTTLLSHLYRCTLLTPPAAELRCVSGVPATGQWTWHGICPPDRIDAHRHYAEFFQATVSARQCGCQV